MEDNQKQLLKYITDNTQKMESEIDQWSKATKRIITEELKSRLLLFLKCISWFNSFKQKFSRTSRPLFRVWKTVKNSPTKNSINTKIKWMTSVSTLNFSQTCLTNFKHRWKRLKRCLPTNRKYLQQYLQPIFMHHQAQYHLLPPFHLFL